MRQFQCTVCGGDFIESLCGGMGGHRTERLCHCFWSDMKKVQYAFEWFAYYLLMMSPTKDAHNLGERPGMRPRDFSKSQ